MSDRLQLLLDELVARVAERAAEIVLERLDAEREQASPLMTLEAAAAYLGVSKQRLYKRGDIPRVKHGHRLLFNRSELDGYLGSLR